MLSRLWQQLSGQPLLRTVARVVAASRGCGIAWLRGVRHAVGLGQPRLRHSGRLRDCNHDVAV